MPLTPGVVESVVREGCLVNEHIAAFACSIEHRAWPCVPAVDQHEGPLLLSSQLTGSPSRPRGPSHGPGQGVPSKRKDDADSSRAVNNGDRRKGEQEGRIEQLLGPVAFAPAISAAPAEMVVFSLPAARPRRVHEGAVGGGLGPVGLRGGGGHALQARKRDACRRATRVLKRRPHGHVRENLRVRDKHQRRERFGDRPCPIWRHLLGTCCWRRSRWERRMMHGSGERRYLRKRIIDGRAHRRI
mmetsp:Transcript_2501/g.5454  ORF Transcript_2501/g.5454 Transcript_2501/m.5454 type:complete len:243 (+) Transcript_2501:849-1577(+)